MSRPLRVGFAVVLAVLGLTFAARQVLYVRAQHEGFDPQPPGRERPADLGLVGDSLAFDSGGHRLAGWWMPAAGADSGAVVLFQGNAENTSDWLGAAKLLHDHHLDVMLFDYSGYGRSGGTPSVDAVIEDGVRALHEFRRRAPHGVRRVGAGLSLGAAVLMEAAAREPEALDGVSLLEPFSSGREVAVHEKLLPGWAAPLMPDVFDNVALARTLRVPLVVVHSRGDQRFPVAFAAAIAHAAPGRSRLVVLDGYSHAAARKNPSEAYWAPVVALAHGAP